MNRPLKYWVLTCFLVTCFVSGKAQEKVPLSHFFSRWANQEILEHASIGLYVQDAKTGEGVLQSSPQVSLTPASTLKLLTTAAALELLGPDYRFETRLAYQGYIQNDTLFGDLNILGGGDPALGSIYFKEHYLKNHFQDTWVKALKDLNVRHITGKLVADASVYDDQFIPNTWIWEDLGNYYGAGACGLSVYDNLYEIHLSSPATAGKTTKFLSTKPQIPGLEFDNRVLSADDPRDQAYVFGSPLNNQRTIRGSIPKGKADFVVKASIPNPPFLLAWQLKNRLAEADIQLTGEIQVIWEKQKNAEDKEMQKLKVIATTISPPLSDIVSVTNHESVNLFAEHLLKHLAYLKTGLGSTKEGIEVVTDFWKEKGIDTRGLYLADGSGLSHFNAMTAEQMVQVLHYMKTKSASGSYLFQSLPTVPNGTLWYFRPELFPRNTLLAKSGSMTRVRCFAGQLTTITGRELLFAVFVNNFSCTQRQAIQAIEELLAELAKR
ncbi:D-alanyl-D-alanine carboxypeptidase/D-alanyl-D-alanine endopeptidase [Gaoshiqia sediminis]|uniref:D-alanyl-D-alanine carboxypeptidase/D-alanyl-D-alanine-endopeptidase n=1 Tax=Gaoshiqia sediminis TaxID=2986998 RepID=A0AA41YAZ3_9BACT|nr:D-alanyl-D-alanine carboxypeptidase/D-alanyl-D-alanine-endopeptidase [Gaoshiqia sediminis]MCW0482783.1 D-alanyl-D-alanine carboxypeptidase/D-alanyl-D-alanine-endopeptidase [Gaoshiqia sediminis]